MTDKDGKKRAGTRFPFLRLALPAALLLLAAGRPVFSRDASTAAAAARGDGLVIGIREFLSDLPAMIAAADGLYALEGAKVRTVIRPQGKDNETMLLDGSLDLALVGGHIGPNLFSKTDKDSPFVILASLGGGGRRWRLMAGARSGISSLEGLKEKRIGVWPSSYGYHLLARHLAAKGIRHSIVRIPMDPEKAVKALQAGEADAILAWEPIPALLEDRKLAREIFTLEGFGAGVPVYLAARKESVRKNPEAVAGILRALDRAAAFIRKSPDEAARRGAASLHTAARILKKALRYHEFRLGLTCAQRGALADAAGLAAEYNKGEAVERGAVEFDTAPLREFLRKRGKGPAVPFEETCPSK